MSERAVYDTMVFFQWAALPEGRQHGTLQAVLTGKIQLCLSPAILNEIKDLLGRPNIRARSANLSDEHIERFLKQVRHFATMFAPVALAFTWPQHPDDDHVFNLAIQAQAKYLVTWESRILELPTSSAPAAKLLKELAPQLSIVTPKQLAEILKTSAGKE